MFKALAFVLVLSALLQINAQSCCGTTACAGNSSCCFTQTVQDPVCGWASGSVVSSQTTGTILLASFLTTYTPNNAGGWGAVSASCQTGITNLVCNQNSNYSLTGYCAASGALPGCCQSSCVSIFAGACSAVTNLTYVTVVGNITLPTATICGYFSTASNCKACSAGFSLVSSPIVAIFAIVMAFISKHF